VEFALLHKDYLAFEKGKHIQIQKGKRASHGFSG
jgi:hypothetical protein